MRLRRIVTLACLLLLFPASAVRGWSEAGHKIIASIAFRQLSPAQQSKLAALLKQHPRYAEDFAPHMPPEVGKGAAEIQGEWLLQQAAIWPDMARGLPDDLKQKYNHPTWHYIDLPTFLSDADRTAIEKSLSLNQSLDPPNSPQSDMNAVQTIRLARKTLAARPASEAEAAVWLCWLLHDVGDLHQPLHSTAMFSTNLFPEGDKGGNSVPTQQGFNLHALWDEFLGDWTTFAAARRRAGELSADVRLAQLGRTAAAQLDEKQWLTESRQLVDSVVYTPEVLGYLRVQPARTDGRPPLPLRVSEEYLTTGVRIATDRVVQAGFRLGAVLKPLAGE
ncbi:MAG TPA: S1/P1 nuclease [Pirellulales bacterium]|jgi:hypothetical protein